MNNQISDLDRLCWQVKRFITCMHHKALHITIGNRNGSIKVHIIPYHEYHKCRFDEGSGITFKIILWRNFCKIFENLINYQTYMFVVFLKYFLLPIYNCLNLQFQVDVLFFNLTYFSFSKFTIVTAWYKLRSQWFIIDMIYKVFF